MRRVFHFEFLIIKDMGAREWKTYLKIILFLFPTAGLISVYFLNNYEFPIFNLVRDLVLVLGFRGYDILSTYILLNRGGRESNPIMDDFYGKYGYLNVFILNVAIIPIFLIAVLIYHGLRNYYFGLYFLVIISTVAGTNNVIRALMKSSTRE